MHGRHEIGKVVGTGLIGLEDHSEDLVFILGEMGAAELLNLGQVEVGGYSGCFPFHELKSTSATSMERHRYMPHPQVAAE